MDQTTQQLLQEIKILKEQVATLNNAIEELRRQQLKLPIDKASMQALSQAFLDSEMFRIKLGSLIFKSGESKNPVFEGQMIYHTNSGTPVIKVLLGGSVKTITTS